ncbi:MAG: 1-(5-phosphoribosyl)-5-[(5-phosphoribosylamino)methylideneamino]imidazole-4-carboxamide isomerase [Chloroflexota bacterium]
MEVIPAIDIRNGRCVRLYQGDYDRETVYSEDPVEMALRWESQGAPRLHLVDLDGAVRGRPVNLKTVEAIVRAVRVPVQIGGGIRTKATAEEMLSLGVKRVILGTAAVEDPALVKELCAKYGEAIIVGIDARDGKVATRGWVGASGVSTEELAGRMVEAGVKRIIYTDISRDGTLTEPNFAAIGRLVKSVKAAVIASGGVSSAEHVRKLAPLGVEGVIIGRALYTGDVKLKEALAAAGGSYA